MWLMFALLSALCLVALIEHLHWKYWTCWIDEQVRQARTHEAVEEAMKHIELLRALESTVGLAEQLYLATSEYGCPYHDHTRVVVANALGAMHKLIGRHTGPNPFIVQYAPQGRWPFDAEGKVKVER